MYSTEIKIESRAHYVREPAQGWSVWKWFSTQHVQQQRSKHGRGMLRPVTTVRTFLTKGGIAAGGILHRQILM